jgi:hypothetical protein
MSAMGELDGKDLPRAIPAEELQTMLEPSGAFCSWNAPNPMVSTSVDRWPFLFSPPLKGTRRKPIL